VVGHPLACRLAAAAPASIADPPDDHRPSGRGPTTDDRRPTIDSRRPAADDGV
jgi:hypothetical protein